MNHHVKAETNMPSQSGTAGDKTAHANRDITFFRAYPDAPDILQADKSACGTLPAAAFQYCEAVRQASAFGWHVHAPKDIHLLHDGAESFYYEDEQWYPVKSANLEDDFRQHWNTMAPKELEGRDPPYLSEIFVPGVIQVWTGYMVSTRPGMSLLMRPPVNSNPRTSYTCFEGVVRADSFQPMPLFINIKLNAVNREIFIPKYKPLFQVQAIPHEVIYNSAGNAAMVELSPKTTEEFDWNGFAGTIRSTDAREQHRPGRYAGMARKAARQDK